MLRNINDVYDVITHSRETVMLERLLDNAKAFYQKPENIQAFEAWKNKKEDPSYGTADHNHV